MEQDKGKTKHNIIISLKKFKSGRFSLVNHILSISYAIGILNSLKQILVRHLWQFEFQINFNIVWFMFELSKFGF